MRLNLSPLFGCLEVLDVDDSGDCARTNAEIEATLGFERQKRGNAVVVSLNCPGKVTWKNKATGRHGTYWASDVTRNFQDAITFGVGISKAMWQDLLTDALGIMDEWETNDLRDLPRAICIASLDRIVDGDMLTLADTYR
jgi:hypothetical protein